MIGIDDQLKEARRELALRMSVYPKHVQRRSMTQGQADYHLAALKAIIATLERYKVEEKQMPLFATSQNPWS